MRNILTVFLVSSLLLYLPEGERAAGAKEVFHTFVIGVYFFPLLGGWLADRFFGKYHTILWLSLVYCAGQACLALFVTNRTGFFVGLGLIALGSGGIKPCVAAFVGDQFDQTNKHRAKVVFDAFYWIINFGSLFASFLMPIFLRQLGPAVAFGIPGALMFVSVVVFWLGRKRYIMLPPAPPDPHSFLRISRDAIARRPRWKNPRRDRRGRFHWLTPAYTEGRICHRRVSRARRRSSRSAAWASGFNSMPFVNSIRPKAIEGVRSVLRVLVLFALVTPFWSLFDQKASTWVLQANAMTKPNWFQPSQMQALNPALVMLLIPFNNLVLYPALNRLGYTVTALRRMTAGIAFAGLAWIVVGAMQVVLDRGNAFTITWQVLPYILLTFGEVLVATTGLEFAYSQAPLSMKGAIMAFWNLSVTIGNLWVLVSNAGVQNSAVTKFITSSGFGVTAFQMFFFAVFAFAAALVFGLVARKYPMVDYYRKEVT